MVHCSAVKPSTAKVATKGIAIFVCSATGALLSLAFIVLFCSEFGMDASPTIGLINTFPEASAVVVLLLGFFIAKLAQRQAVRLMRLFDRLVSRYATGESTVISPQLTQLGQTAVYWLIALLTVLIALRILGAGELSNWLDGILDFVPRIIVGMLIIGAGHFFGVIAKFLISGLSETIDQDSLGPRMAHIAIVIIAIVFGLQQMLIDISFITQLLLIPLLVVGSAMALAFALGAKDYVANIIAQTEWDRFNIGDRIRIDDIEGEIVEKSGVAIRLETPDGIVSIPCSRFLQTNVLLTRSEIDDD